MQPEIDETDSLKICIARLEVKNAELRKKFAEIEARNAELKARIAKLEDNQTQNELIKNLIHIIDRLPESLVKRACEKLLHHSKDPVPLESIFRKKKRKTMAQEKVLRPQSWPECNVSPALPIIHVVDSGVQTEEIAHDHEEENNRRVVNELKVLSQHLFDYNKRTFEKFMQDIEREYRERVTANKRL
ncbi:hypothetical protein GLOIN_2v1779908 [Rhizophagus irregularis DAOM 181602=DAOM 197198]|uniref:Uncharacterized protein n=1 Tax=Rhizophagus irregularis (strain DAOM 181602 / DAOM 197198 / MUCL 43194) TaxID=747089 RepID=A0A2P4PNU2_RHIID|nr:hypothetical protein GLOIN_2v1779908 [Rhizophagus irregularis DAOM 181602=DAOM 197198]POG67042.1 hypothetical protein GLOIN_2v1779908 [Rhizophagus irregularis DAOM 181602=DAOM 197198]|eukprot:XP_025173908.1 hypothetical protein GLOIN_2v1779908 [Rhizophagus irregularis DAOM 181602=DAOM 197198]